MNTLDDIEPTAPGATTGRSSVITQAVIMAGGKGTRLHPYSALFPKPLMPLGDMPVLELLLRRMKRAGVTDVILAVNHRGDLIKTFFGDGSQLGLRNPLQSRGPAARHRRRARQHAGGARRGLPRHQRGSADHDGPRRDGAAARRDRLRCLDWRVPAREQDRLRSDRVRHRQAALGTREKPTSLYYVSMGVYVLRREAVRPCIMPGEYLDMPSLLLKMRANDANIRCYHDDCMWLDIGRPDDFALAQSMFEHHREIFLGE